MHLTFCFDTEAGGTRNWPTLSVSSFCVSVLLACSADILFGRVNVFARESAVLKLHKRGGKGCESKGAGEGAEREKRKCVPVFFSLLPLPPFLLSPQHQHPCTLKAAISTLRNVPLSLNRRWQLKQYEHKQAFARPKYACSAGYCFTDLLNLCYRGVD